MSARARARARTSSRNSATVDASVRPRSSYRPSGRSGARVAPSAEPSLTYTTTGAGPASVVLTEPRFSVACHGAAVTPSVASGGGALESWRMRSSSFWSILACSMRKSWCFRCMVSAGGEAQRPSAVLGRQDLKLLL